MRSRRALLFLVLVVTLASVIGWLIWPARNVTPENGNRIQQGMRLSEVQSIIGGPPGNYGGAHFHAYRYLENGISLGRMLALQEHPEEGRILAWTGPEYAIIVELDADERVVTYSIGSGPVWEGTWWRRLLQSIGIQ
jgi:hypothetical protein